jgi:hypothetical protein
MGDGKAFSADHQPDDHLLAIEAMVTLHYDNCKVATLSKFYATKIPDLQII